MSMNHAVVPTFQPFQPICTQHGVFGEIARVSKPSWNTWNNGLGRNNHRAETLMNTTP